MNIAIYGAGGFGRETALMVRQINAAGEKWNLVGFFDDGKKIGESIDGLPVLGGRAEVNTVTESLAICLAIAEPAARKSIRSNLTNGRLTFPTLVHPSVQQGDRERNTIGEGCIITAGNIMTTNICVGDFVIINLMNTIGHDVKVGDFSSIMPGCSLSGFITIGDQVLIGSGARILPGVEIESASKVGAGAVVLEKVKRGSIVVGVPARAL